MHLKTMLAALAGLAFTAPVLASVSTLQRCFTGIIAAGLKDIISLPGSAIYDASISSYWAETAQLHPWLVLRPRSTRELSIIVKLITAIPKLKFAVRSGGHMNWAGANNINDGVTIDLSLMDTVSYDAASQLASIGPGGHWKNVYTALEPSGVTVAGGRDGNVGVAGYLLGGGNSYYATRTGMACNTVRNYEVVLADGSIVNANADENADLFHALKGGGNNFGIVTRFDLETLTTTELWGGNILYSKDATSDLLDTLTTFIDNNAANTDSTFVGLWTYTPDFQDIVCLASVFNIDGQPDPNGVFADFQAVEPKLAMPSLGVISMAEAARTMFLPPGEYSTWYTMTYKNDADLSRFMAARHEELVAFCKEHVDPTGNFSTQVVFQPFPRVFIDEGEARGGNVLGLEDSLHDDAVLLLFTTSFNTAAQRSAAAAKQKSLFQAMQQEAQSRGMLYDWQYLNYADPSQNPLASYGAANVAKIRAAAAKYDPKAVFQTRVPGGYKISKV
jgi:hypothetical protein